MKVNLKVPGHLDASCFLTCQTKPSGSRNDCTKLKRELVVYRANTRLIIASIPTPDAPRCFEAAPVYVDGVAAVPRSFVADGRIGEPVAADPGPEPKPEPKPPEEPAKPVGLAFPVAITYPLLAAIGVELHSNLSTDPQCHSMKSIPNG